LWPFKENNGIIDIDQLQSHGIGASDINKLKAAGYWTIAVRNQLNT